MAAPLVAIAIAAAGAASGTYGARERGRALMQEGTELRIQADIEELNAQISENDLRDALVRTLASNNAAAAASGVSGPSVAAAAIDDNEVAGRAVKIRNLESLFKVNALRRQAKSLDKQGKAAIITGTVSSITSAAGPFFGKGGAMGGGGGGGGG